MVVDEGNPWPATAPPLAGASRHARRTRRWKSGLVELALSLGRRVWVRMPLSCSNYVFTRLEMSLSRWGLIDTFQVFYCFLVVYVVLWSYCYGRSRAGWRFNWFYCSFHTVIWVMPMNGKRERRWRKYQMTNIKKEMVDDKWKGKVRW